MSPIVVFTAQIGEPTDPLRAPLVIDPQARYLCFSDRRVSVPPYEWIAVPSSATPRLASRAYKVLADHPALAGARLTLWHDASYRLTRDVRWVRDALQQHELAAFKQVRRKPRTLKKEASQLVRYGYLSKAAAAAHLRRYREDGFVLRGTITCGGLLARRGSARMTAFNQRWWMEVQRWGGRDQTSLDYVAWLSGIVVGHLEGRIKENGYAQFRESGAEVAA